MHRLAVVLLFSAGCGRIGFDAQSSTIGDGSVDTSDGAKACVAVGHDEDGDGFDDACDVCPHLSGPQLDGDGDGVGDACDPEPTIARQSITLFDPFTSLDNWTNLGGTLASGEVTLDAIGTTPRELIRNNVPITQELFVVGMSAGAAGTGQYNFAIVTAPTSPPGGFYCELFDGGGQFTTTMFTWTTDDTSYMHAGVDDWPTGSHFANGSGTFSYDLTASTATCRSVWNGTPHGGTGARPAITPQELHIYAENVAVRVQYFLQIHTN